MNKKTNTLCFILGATVFNILVTIFCFVVLLLLYARLAALLPEESGPWGFPVIFIGAIVLSFLIYRLILKQIQKRVDMDKYFDPLFGPKKPNP
jgi:hypothetical protein